MFFFIFFDVDIDNSTAFLSSNFSFESKKKNFSIEQIPTITSLDDTKMYFNYVISFPWRLNV